MPYLLAVVGRPGHRRWSSARPTERVVIRRFAGRPACSSPSPPSASARCSPAVALLLPRPVGRPARRRPHRRPRSTLTVHGRPRHLRRQRPPGPAWSRRVAVVAGRPVPAAAATPASPSGPAPTRPTGRRCSASPSTGCRRWCGRWPRRWPSSPCSCAAASSACPRAPALGLRRPAAGARRPAARPPHRPAGGHHERGRPRRARAGRRVEPRASQLIDPILGRSWSCALVPAAPRRGRVDGTEPTSSPGRRPRRSGRCPPTLAAPPGRALPAAGRLRRPGVVAGGRRCRRSSTSTSSLKASALLIYAMLGVSLVLLSGWARHGLARPGRLLRHRRRRGRLAAVAIVARRPVRRRSCSPRSVGAVAAAAGGHARPAAAGPLPGGHHASPSRWPPSSYLLNDEFFDWVPDRAHPAAAAPRGLRRLDRRPPCYYLALVVLVLVIVGVRGIRPAASAGRWWRCATTTGRRRPTASSATRVQLAPSPSPGRIAALAGGLFVHHQQSFDPSLVRRRSRTWPCSRWSWSAASTSLTGAVLGRAVPAGHRSGSSPTDWQFLASGLGRAGHPAARPRGPRRPGRRGRDAALRALARARGLQVPGYSATLSATDPATLTGAPDATTVTGGPDAATVDWRAPMPRPSPAGPTRPPSPTRPTLPLSPARPMPPPSPTRPTLRRRPSLPTWLGTRAPGVAGAVADVAGTEHGPSRRRQWHRDARRGRRRWGGSVRRERRRGRPCQRRACCRRPRAGRERLGVGGRAGRRGSDRSGRAVARRSATCCSTSGASRSATAGCRCSSGST